MNRFVARIIVALASSALAFVVADVVLDSFVVRYPLGLIIPVVIFSLATAVIAPVVDAMIEKYATWASIFVGLVITFLALLVTDLVSDNLEIEGVSTWLLGTAIVWLASIVTAVLVRRLVRDAPSPHR